jgi:hypothetical protein
LLFGEADGKALVVEVDDVQQQAGDRSGACPGGALMGIARRDGFGSAMA